MEYVFELCSGRHSTPASKSIFQTTLNPLDTEELHRIADAAIPTDATKLVVYVTGLTVAMLSVVKVCLERGISLTAMHYDRESGEYYSQLVIG